METTTTLEQIASKSIHQAEVLTPSELDTLWTAANAAIATDDYPAAYLAVEALLVQSDHHNNVVKDYLSLPFTPFPGRSRDSILPLIDRVDALNFAIRHARRIAK